MNPKKKDQMITYAVVAVVALIMVMMAAMMYMYGTGGMSEVDMLMLSTAFSSVMFIVVIIYGLYSYKAKNSLMEYKKFEEMMRKEEEEKKE